MKVKNNIKDTDKNITDKIEYTNKDIFYNSLKVINHKLDMVRNSIFNVIITNNYVNLIEFDFKIELTEIDKSINLLDSEISKLIKKIDVKFNERKEKN